MRQLSVTLAILVLLISALAVLADEPASESAEGMPPMGPPQEIQDLAFLVGEWKITGQMRMDPSQENWSDFTATCTYNWIVEGGAIAFDYQSQMMGMPLVGHGLQAYNRETKKWQSVWVDNFGCNLYYQEGNRNDKGDLVFSGIGHWQGQEFHNRLIISNETETSFDWRMEDSYDGGQTYGTTMKATYTKAE